MARIMNPVIKLNAIFRNQRSTGNGSYLSYLGTCKVTKAQVAKLDLSDDDAEKLRWSQDGEVAWLDVTLLDSSSQLLDNNGQPVAAPNSYKMGDFAIVRATIDDDPICGQDGTPLFNVRDTADDNAEPYPAEINIDR